MAKEDQSARIGKNLDWAKIQLIDDKNRPRMKEIIEKYGYISPSVYGKDAAKSAWLLIQHFPPTDFQTMELYLNFIKQNPEGFDTESLALFEDRINVYNNKPQVYGSQAYCPTNSKTWCFREIVDIKNVDKRRKQIGLVSLKEYAKVMEKYYQYKLELPKGYIEQS